METNVETEVTKTAYCIPLELRDEQIKHSTRRFTQRFEPALDLKRDPVAIVGFGPSLRDTWREVRNFKHIITMSGSHKFLLKRDVKPDMFQSWTHVEVDPRRHKITLLGRPHPQIKYLIASCCHPEYFDHLRDMDITLWHVFAHEKDAGLSIPRGEWSLTGGINVGLRTMAIARFMGFQQQHVFGMDCCIIKGRTHAEDHCNAPKKKGWTKREYNGEHYTTTGAMISYSQNFFHELAQLPDVSVKLHGVGLLQHMAYMRIQEQRLEEKTKGGAIGLKFAPVISDEYLAMQKQYHLDRPEYGITGFRRVELVTKLAAALKTQSVLDYGCGKSTLAKGLKFPIWEYDPCIPGKDSPARPADLVICNDVLEHIEPEFLDNVIVDLKRCTKQVCYAIIYTQPANKDLPDGRNAHLIIKDKDWWAERLGKSFKIGKVIEKGPELHLVMSKRTSKRSV